MPGQDILLKRSDVENKIPLTGDLEYGELAVNYFDGNIFLKNTKDEIVEFKRLDSRLNDANIISMTYTPSGDVEEVIYSTGNKTSFYYDDRDNLVNIFYYGVDAITHLYTQILTYNEEDDLISTSWIKV